MTWANTCIPLSERIDQLTVTTPWRLNLKEAARSTGVLTLQKNVK